MLGNDKFGYLASATVNSDPNNDANDTINIYAMTENSAKTKLLHHLNSNHRCISPSSFCILLILLVVREDYSTLATNYCNSDNFQQEVFDIATKNCSLSTLPLPLDVVDKTLVELRDLASRFWNASHPKTFRAHAEIYALSYWNEVLFPRSRLDFISPNMLIVYLTLNSQWVVVKIKLTYMCRWRWHFERKGNQQHRYLSTSLRWSAMLL